MKRLLILFPYCLAYTFVNSSSVIWLSLLESTELLNAANSFGPRDTPKDTRARPVHSVGAHVGRKEIRGEGRRGAQEG